MALLFAPFNGNNSINRAQRRPRILRDEQLEWFRWVAHARIRIDSSSLPARASSAEYLISQVKLNKPGAILTMGLLLLTTALILLWYFKHIRAAVLAMELLALTLSLMLFWYLDRLALFHSLIKTPSCSLIFSTPQAMQYSTAR